MQHCIVPWINEEFVEKVVRKFEKDDSIRVGNVSIAPATNKGDNYTSDMYRVTTEFTRKLGSKKVTEKRSIIVKVAPAPEPGNDFRDKLISNNGIFDIEISMMSDTLVRMNRILGSNTPLNADALFTRTEKPTILVLEDLAPLGFRMANRELGLDLAHCLLAVRRIAEFHASSVALKEKDPEAVMRYTRGLYHKDHGETLGNLYKAGTKSLGEHVANWPELGPRYGKKIMNYSKVVYERACEAARCKEDEFNVLNHGDCYINNMLFKHDDQGNPIGHIFVDFQFPRYGSPVIDLFYFLVTSPTDEVRVNDQELLVKEYHNSLVSTMLRLNCETRAPSYEELKKTMDDRAILPMTYSFANLPMVLIDKSKVKDFDELMGEEGNFENPGYEGKIYREIMLRMIPIYDKMGLLDI